MGALGLALGPTGAATIPGGVVGGTALGGGIGGLAGSILCSSGGANRGGKGERNQAAKPDGTANPEKYVRLSQTNPVRYEVKDTHTGKWVLKGRD